MPTILDLAKSVISAPPPGAPGTYYYGGTSWCQTFVGDSLTKAGILYAGSFPSANAARKASTIVSTDPTKAPPGAIHYWLENHVAIACGPGNGIPRHVAATGRAAGAIASLGKNVFVHDTAPYPLHYAGWSYQNGKRPQITGYTDPYATPVAKNQRQTNVPTKRRTGASRDFPDGADNLPTGSIYTPEGWINGEVIDGTGVWFKIGGLYSHASCFTDRGTHDLLDLNVYTGQRRVKTGIGNARLRAAATTSSDNLAAIAEGSLLAVTEYEVGEAVDSGGVTSNTWFKTTVNGLPGYVWAGSFTDSSTTDLTNVTPATPPAVDYTRKAEVGSNIRQYPATNSVIKGSVEASTELTVKEYTRGEAVDQRGKPSDIWYRVPEGWVWSGGFDSQSIEGLTLVDVEIPAQQYPDTQYTFLTDLPGVVDRVVPADWSNFENVYSVPDNTDGTNSRKGFPTKPTDAVEHQWGAPGIYSLESVLNTFTARHTNDSDKVAPHFTVGINTITGVVEIIQNVQLAYRAYHAGAGGNDYVGIEIDSRISNEGIGLEILKAVRRLLAGLAEFYGYRLGAKYHGDLPGANTSCGQYIKPWSSLIDAPFEGDSDTPPVDDRSVAAIIAAMKLEADRIIAEVDKIPTAEENGDAARAAIVK